MYVYDSANRLTSVNGQEYTWDNNGNLLDDGVYSYAYDRANRLAVVRGPEVSSTYAYNGLGERMQQTVDVQTTDFIVDQAGGLTQVLSDGADSYLYGLRRIAEQDAEGWQYYVGDALGSVRQLVDESGEVRLAKGYEPYGSVLSSAGDAESRYGFAGEWTDYYIKLQYLRSRWYSTELGRFLAKDSWQGYYFRPLSLNEWNYVESNPVNFKDPSGYLKDFEEIDADNIRYGLKNQYGIIIEKDYGFENDNARGYGACSAIVWHEGAWKTLDELKWVQQAVLDTAIKMGGAHKLKSAMVRQVTIVRRAIQPVNLHFIGPPRAFAPPFGSVFGDINLPDYTFLNGVENAKYAVVHELGHVWDRRSSLRLSSEMKVFLGTWVCINDGMGGTRCHFDIQAGRERPPGIGDYDKNYAGKNAMEDWAEAFASTIYPNYYGSLNAYGYWALGPIREQFVRDQFNSLP